MNKVKFNPVKDSMPVRVSWVVSKMEFIEVNVYDPLGYYSMKSPYYVKGLMDHAVMRGLIDSYSYIGELPAVPSELGTIY